MSIEAAEALRLAGHGKCRDLRLVASGRSSSAWAASTASGEWIVRVPIPESGRRLSYRSEAKIGELLHKLGHPVPTWTPVRVGAAVCSVGPLLTGSPVAYDEPFTPDFAQALGRLLFDLHHLDADGYGPLIDDDRTLRGRSQSPRAGIVDRWLHARIWPFDGTDLYDHVVKSIAPDIAATAAELRSAVLHAARGTVGIVHSDLHREHLLRNESGQLAAVLDFGDAFRGACAWDFALLHWYYGAETAARVAAHYPDTTGVNGAGARLAVVVGLYKLAKNPTDPAVPARLGRVVEDARSTRCSQSE